MRCISMLVLTLVAKPGLAMAGTRSGLPLSPAPGSFATNERRNANKAGLNGSVPIRSSVRPPASLAGHPPRARRLWRENRER